MSGIYTSLHAALICIAEAIYNIYDTWFTWTPWHSNGSAGAQVVIQLAYQSSFWKAMKNWKVSVIFLSMSGYLSPLPLICCGLLPHKTAHRAEKAATDSFWAIAKPLPMEFICWSQMFPGGFYCSAPFSSQTLQLQIKKKCLKKYHSLDFYSIIIKSRYCNNSHWRSKKFNTC